MNEPKFIELNFQKIASEAEQIKRAEEFYENLNNRRTVRDFSEKQVPFEIIEKAIQTAGTAPSGANMQPWRFVVVRSPKIKKKIREAAEREPDSILGQRMAAGEAIDAKAVNEAATAGDQAAIGAIDLAGHYLGQTVPGHPCLLGQTGGGDKRVLAEPDDCIGCA